ncbi:MAG: tRNA (adenosine(37)-N6)-dimethylallyltransferase MiaA [Spirochaetia bacterium]
MNRLPPFVVLFGPTAAGKTTMVQALHRAFVSSGGIELISADSAQVYRGMDIGTAKPPRSMRADFSHHLIDIRDPDEPFTAGDFVSLSEAALRGAASRGALPVVAGGTAFYIRSLLYGLPEVPAADPWIRRQLEEELVRRGTEALRTELEAVDPASASRISPADRYRLVRALEVFRSTGRPRSSFKVPDTLRPDIHVCCIALDLPRAELYDRINRRVEHMLDEGLESEVRSLIRAGYGPRDPGMRAIGYREFLSQSSDSGVEVLPAQEVAATIQRNTRRYAKRQITFFRSFECAEWMSAGEPPAIISRISEFLAAAPD